MSGRVTHKHAALLMLLTLLCVFAVPTGLVVLVDPDHIFHKPLSFLPWHGFDSYAQVQNAGMVNSYLADPNSGYNAILVGSSVSENFRPEYVASKLPGQKLMKLTAPSADPSMQRMLVEHALRTEQVQHVYWEVFSNQYSFLDMEEYKKALKLYPDMLRESETAFLYNGSRLDDYRYIFNFYSLAASWNLLRGPDKDYSDDIDHVRYWGRNCYRDRNCYIYTEQSNIDRIMAEFSQRERAIKYGADQRAPVSYLMLDIFMLPLVMAHCNGSTRFDIYFPPVTLLWFTSMTDEEFDYHFYMPRHVVQAVAACRNVRVFGFHDDAALTGDLSNFHDKFHYRGEINDRVIDFMASGQHQLTVANMDAYEAAWLQNINQYRPYATILHGQEDMRIYEK